MTFRGIYELTLETPQPDRLRDRPGKPLRGGCPASAGQGRPPALGRVQVPLKRSPRLRKHLRPLRRQHISCEISDSSCPPPLFGRIADRWLVPWD